MQYKSQKIQYNSRRSWVPRQKRREHTPKNLQKIPPGVQNTCAWYHYILINRERIRERKESAIAREIEEREREKVKSGSRPGGAQVRESKKRERKRDKRRAREHMEREGGNSPCCSRVGGSPVGPGSQPATERESVGGFGGKGETRWPCRYRDAMETYIRKAEIPSYM